MSQYVSLCLSTSQYVSVRLNISQDASVRLSTSQYVSVRLTMSQYFSVCLSMSQYVSVRLSTSQYVLVCLSMSQYVSLRLSMSQYVLLCLSTSQYVLVCLSMSQYVPVCLSMSLNSTSWHKKRSVPWPSRLLVGLSPRKTGFDPRSFLVGIVVDKLTLGQIILRVLRSLLFHYHFTNSPSVQKDKREKPGNLRIKQRSFRYKESPDRKVLSNFPFSFSEI